MKQYIYPAVLTKDEDNNIYIISLYDLELFTEGETVEEAYLNAKSYLENYLACCLKLDAEFDAPSSFDDMQKRFPNDMLMMIEADINEIKFKKF